MSPLVDTRVLAAQKEPGSDPLAVRVAVRAMEAKEPPGVVVLVALPAMGILVGQADPEVYGCSHI